MEFITLNIDMTGRRVLVAGGGPVALRKVRLLLRSGADVLLVSPACLPEMQQLSSEGKIRWRAGLYDPADMDDAFLAIAATDDPAVNLRVADDARARGILILVADAPAAGDCHFPALLQRGDLRIAVSSGGRCPAFAAAVRDRIAEVIGEEYGAALSEAAEKREKLLTEGNGSTYNNKIVRSLAQRLVSELSEHKERS